MKFVLNSCCINWNIAKMNSSSAAQKHFYIYYPLLCYWPKKRWMVWLPATVMRLLRDLRFLFPGTLISGLPILCLGCGTGGTFVLFRLAVVGTLVVTEPTVVVTAAFVWFSACNHCAATSCAGSCSCSGCDGGTSPRTIMRDSPPTIGNIIPLFYIYSFLLLIYTVCPV